MKTQLLLPALGLLALPISCTTTGTTGTASSPGTASTTAATSSVKPYPLDTCIVTDNRLGSMGRPITKVYQGQEVKFCCAPCVEEFEENPEKFLAKLP